SFLPGKRSNFAAARDVPQFGCPVVASRCNETSVRAKGRTGNQTGMPVQNGDQTTGSGVPHAGRSIRTGGGQPSIAGIGDSEDLPHVPPQSKKANVVG